MESLNRSFSISSLLSPLYPPMPSPLQYMCPSGRMCTYSSVFCLRDGSACVDGSDIDQHFCRGYDCPATYSKCRNNYTCLYNGQFCNGVRDCPGECGAQSLGGVMQ